MASADDDSSSDIPRSARIDASTMIQPASSYGIGTTADSAPDATNGRFAAVGVPENSLTLSAMPADFIAAGSPRFTPSATATSELIFGLARRKLRRRVDASLPMEVTGMSVTLIEHSAQYSSMASSKPSFTKLYIGKYEMSTKPMFALPFVSLMTAAAKALPTSFW